MTNRQLSLNTKLKFSQSLKSLMSKKPMNKITVSELVTACGVNRNTFYYHFKDINDLLKWTLENEAVEILKRFDPDCGIHESLHFILDYVESNAAMLNCAYDSLGRDEMKRFLYADFIEILKLLVSVYERDLPTPLTEESKNIVCDFYAEGIAGILINWFKDPKLWGRQDIVDCIETVISSTLPTAVQAVSRT